eukprot:3033371-Pyramimonas_sp.AAC.1
MSGFLECDRAGFARSQSRAVRRAADCGPPTQRRMRAGACAHAPPTTREGARVTPEMGAARDEDLACSCSEQGGGRNFTAPSFVA